MKNKDGKEDAPGVCYGEQNFPERLGGVILLLHFP
jgi:hypothetical protein